MIKILNKEDSISLEATQILSQIDCNLNYFHYM